MLVGNIEQNLYDLKHKMKGDFVRTIFYKKEKNQLIAKKVRTAKKD
jgi:hypothetical protein